VKKALVTLFLTALLGSAVAVNGASSAQTGPTLKCTILGCPHRN
jgi:hypothetical protein